MAEVLFEYSLCLIDSTILLFFYLNLVDHEWKWKKAIPAVIIMALIQSFKDNLVDFGTWSSLIDSLLIIICLYFYTFKFTFLNLVSAMLISSIIKSSTMIFVGVTAKLSVDISATHVFGWERILFCIFLKTFVLAIFFITISQLKKLYSLLADKAIITFFFILALVLTTIAFVYGTTTIDDNFLYMIIFVLLVFISVVYLIYHYCIVLKENESLYSIKHSMKLTAQYTKDLEQEHSEIRKIRHDMKNQLLILSDLQNSNQYDEVSHILTSLTKELNKNRKSISGNIYVDAVLRQKQEQYRDIIFNLSIVLDEGFQMEGTDIISLLSNIIDNACEELKRIGKSSFKLNLIGNKTMFEIEEINPCRKRLKLKTDKNTESHGYGLKIIKGIVKKYDGDIVIKTEKEFHLSIVLYL